MIKTPFFAQKSRLAAGLSLALLACGPAVEAAEEKETLVTPEHVKKMEHTIKLQPMSAKEQIAFSRLDLATRLGVEMDVVSVSGATTVRWRSSALGCPEAGKRYTDTLVPGVLIMLRVGNTAYRYHSLPGAEPFYCPSDRVRPAYVGPEDV